MEQWDVGDVSITRIAETDSWAPIDLVLQVLRGATREDLDRIDWLTPHYVRDGMVNALQVSALIVETPTHRIVVDPGIGNDKPRASPHFHLRTDFLERLEQVVPRFAVDGVLSTHLHVDHVGWNTILIDGVWRPTFPNAAYWFVEEEYAHWRAFAADPTAKDAYSEFGWSVVDAYAVFEDSLRPIEEAGAVCWVHAGDTVVPGITLLPTGGHTPGHVSVLIESEGESAVITGDLLHTQAQVAHPEWSPEMDTDAMEAARTRRAFLNRFVDTGTLVLGTHFGTPMGGRLVRDAGAIRLVPELGRIRIHGPGADR